MTEVQIWKNSLSRVTVEKRANQTWNGGCTIILLLFFVLSRTRPLNIAFFLVFCSDLFECPL